MENKNYIQEELLEIAPAIVQIDKKNVYSVSPDYFNQFAIDILGKIRSGDEPVYNFPRLMPYQVPGDYFENFAKSIFQRINEEKEQSEVFAEMENISPLLNSISKKAPYAVPGGYFNKEISIPTVETTIKTAKVISATRFNRSIKYAAAAVITAFLAIGMYLLINTKDYNIPQHNSNPTAEVKKLSEDEIANFLKTNFATEDVSLGSHGNLKESDIKKSVSEMSDNEIQQFLQEEGETDEI